MAATPLAGHAAAAAAGAAASHEPATTPPRHRSHPTQALGEPCVVLKVGETVLKGGNRHHSERLLAENARRAPPARDRPRDPRGPRRRRAALDPQRGHGAPAGWRAQAWRARAWRARA